MRTSPNTIPGFILLVTVAILSAAYSAQYIGCSFRARRGA
jgi:hypothetical protein